jgi:hypothetical protein
MKIRFVALGAALAVSALSTAAFAQQEGLVNISVDGNTVQVPVTVAAQVCPNVAANVLAEAVTTQEVVCEIDQQTAAEHNIGGEGEEDTAEHDDDNGDDDDDDA